jgi:hypothetical protein
MDAINRTDIDTSGILNAYTGLGNDIGHLTPPQILTFSLVANRLSQVNLNSSPVRLALTGLGGSVSTRTT